MLNKNPKTTVNKIFFKKPKRNYILISKQSNGINRLILLGRSIPTSIILFKMLSIKRIMLSVSVSYLVKKGDRK